MRKTRVLQQQLLRWFAARKRDLPWRHARSAYEILVSEVMLQQTQVDRVIPAYRAFLKQFPSLAALARARQATVIRAWAGLGYNGRARNLHQLAKRVARLHGGVLPRTPEALRALPGVGPYTAAAVACFAFGAPVALVDVNVRRVLGRYVRGVTGPRALPEKELWEIAGSLVPPRASIAWNSALMDFGALVCTARKPRCVTCPLQRTCRAYPKVLDGTPPHARAQPFVGSTRYLRGRMVAQLRSGAKTFRTLRACVSSGELSADAFRSILKGLQSDGLVRYVRGKYRL